MEIESTWKGCAVNRKKETFENEKKNNGKTRKSVGAHQWKSIDAEIFGNRPLPRQRPPPPPDPIAELDHAQRRQENSVKLGKLPKTR